MTENTNAEVFAPPRKMRAKQKRILESLSRVNSMTPIQVSSFTGLNRNTVRRELQELLDNELVVKENHAYSLRKTEGE